MSPPYVVVLVLETGDAFDVELESLGAWNEFRQSIRTIGMVTVTKWRKNNNPPEPTSGPFTEDNNLVIPSTKVLYVATNGLVF